MFEDELRQLLEGGYVLGGRVGYRARHELRARADAPIERVDHDEWVQLVISREAREVVVRLETPEAPSPRLVVLRRDDGAAPRVLVETRGLYLGGTFHVVERIDDPVAAEARWRATELPACWSSEPAGGCC
ncbi:MAG: hypothetical protein U0234_31765 [Sandaracinus sp.]